MKKYEIAIVPGDGTCGRAIGHEIVPAGIEVLNAVAEVNPVRDSKAKNL